MRMYIPEVTRRLFGCTGNGVSQLRMRVAILVLRHHISQLCRPHLMCDICFAGWQVLVT